jgi:hypothetical protein
LRREESSRYGLLAESEMMMLMPFRRSVILWQAVSSKWAAVKAVVLALGGKTKAHQQRLRRKLRDASIIPF